jgi:hypothetical protein
MFAGIGALGSTVKSAGLKAVGAIDDIAYKQAMAAIKTVMTAGEAADAVSGGVIALQGAATGNPVGVIAGLASIGTVDVPGKVTKEIAEELAEEGLEKVTKEAVEELAEEGIERVAKEAVEEVAEEAVEKITRETIEHTAREAVEETVEQAARDVIEEASEATGKQMDEVLGEGVGHAQAASALDSLNIKTPEDATLPAAELLPRLHAAKETIESVCDLERLPKVNVEIRELPTRNIDGDTINANGRYTRSLEPGQPALIEIDPRGSAPELSLAHETGHDFDNAFGVLDPTSGERLMGSQAALRGLLKPELQNAYNEVFKAITSSQTYSNLKTALYYATENSYTGMISFTEYLMEPEELFARSYAQHIATRSGNEILVNQVELAAQPIYRHISRAWPSNDFETIDRAFDRLLKVTGMRK